MRSDPASGSPVTCPERASAPIWSGPVASRRVAVATIRRGFRLPWAGIAIVLGVACANLVVAAAVQLHHVPDLLILAVAVPALIALLQRPQRGLLLLVIGLPVSGILLLMPNAPAAAGGWKQFLVLVMLTGTFVGPSENRGAATRPRPKWVIGLVPLLVLGAVSGVLVGGPRAFFGLRSYFFYVFLAWAIWRCPPSRRERDTLVTALMVVGVLEGFYAIVQQYLGPVRLNQLGYEYNTTIGFIGGVMRSFGTFDKPFGLGFFEMLVLLIAVPHMLSEPKRSRTRWFLLFLPFCVLGLAAAVVRGAILGLAVGMAYLGF